MPKIKEKFTIHEVARLNNVGIDSLRYYEKLGLLTPSRGENRYRYYTLDDLVLLNIIREFRQLNFSFGQIKEMLDGRSLAATKELLTHELDLVEEEIANLRQTKKTIRQRLANMTCAFTQMKADTPTVITLPDMKCLHIVDGSHMKVDEIDYYISKYTLEHHLDLSNMIGRYDLYRLDENHLDESGNCTVKEILITNNSMKVKPDLLLSGGNYLGIAYHGNQFCSRDMVICLKNYAAAHQLTLEGDFMEFHIFDFYDTSIEEEYLTTTCIRLKGEATL